MEQVEHYIRQAKAARGLAAAADSEPVRSQFEKIAGTWERLAEERLIILQRKLDEQHRH